MWTNGVALFKFAEMVIVKCAQCAQCAIVLMHLPDECSGFVIELCLEMRQFCAMARALLLQ
jgi:hypothetical protein